MANIGLSSLSLMLNMFKARLQAQATTESSSRTLTAPARRPRRLQVRVQATIRIFFPDDDSDWPLSLCGGLARLNLRDLVPQNGAGLGQFVRALQVHPELG